MVLNDLVSKNVGACGTLRVCRKGTPEIFQKSKIKQGNSPISVCEGAI